MNEVGARTLRVSVISPEAVGFEGEADSVVAPAYDGKLGILYGHAPLMVLLGRGEVRIRSGDRERRVRVAGGFLQVVHNEVSILAEEVHAEEADEVGAEAAPSG